MNRSVFAKIYAVILTLGFIAGEIVLIANPAFQTVDGSIELLVGLVFALFVAPTVHELGHIVFALAMKMQLRYTKFFCVKIQKQAGRYAFLFANPFALDETQVVPTVGGNMQKRATWYTLGGLIFSAGLVCALLVPAILLSCFGISNAFLWASVPYAIYLFCLNVAPFEYANGKTDALVYLGIKKGSPVESAMLLAMDAQGRLFAGERYRELEDEAVKFPVISEDEPLFSICYDIKYRRALDLGDLPLAADCLKRMAQSEAYLSGYERERLASELTYMHAINGDFESANACAKLCEGYLTGATASAKRVLATVAWCAGKTEEAKVLMEQARTALQKEEILGEKYFEEELLSRLT